jgi:hypothetical protein
MLREVKAVGCRPVRGFMSAKLSFVYSCGGLTVSYGCVQSVRAARRRQGITTNVVQRSRSVFGTKCANQVTTIHFPLGAAMRHV